MKYNSDSRILITGGAGFIGANLCEAFLSYGNKVVCLDNFSTGFKKNTDAFAAHENFNLVEGDIRNLNDCVKATKDIDFVLHHAALGSVPRSIKDPVTSTEVNINGFLNMMIACKENKIKRFVYAGSSSTYGDSEALPKVEDKIGTPLSPYALTKFVDELYADVFSKNYQLDTIGFRYFNVFGRRQTTAGPYAAVIPVFVKKLMALEAPVINGDGSFSRDFTYIDNVIQANMLALKTSKKENLNTVYNIAYGAQTTLNELVRIIKEYLSEYDKRIADIETAYAEERAGDIPHSLASIEKARALLGYNPTYSLKEGLKIAVDWYYNNL